MKMMKIAICAITLLALLVPTTFAGPSSAFGVAIVHGDDALAFSAGHGDEIFLGSVATAEGVGDVSAHSSGIVTGDETASSTFSYGSNDVASVGTFVHGIGDTSGFTWAFAER